MKTTNFNWGDKIIDSRDIIARHEELNDEYESLKESLDEAKEDFENFLKIADEELTEKDEDFEERCDGFRELIQEAQEELDQFNSSFDKDELDTLTEVIRQGEDCSDWSYGAQLIHEDYFAEYTEELINECYDFPKEFKEGTWPWCHMDWEAAAEQLKSDYTTIEVDGETYYIRS